MRILLTSVALAVALSGGLAVAQITAPAPQAPPVRVAPTISPFQAAPLCRDREDCDGDGANAQARGGTDCDDNDRDNYPGHSEVADGRGHDEDCDPTTFGHRDQDGDLFISDTAYNTRADGRVFGGNDCNDQDARIRPSAQELPNRLDDDCNGYVDDLAGIWWTPPAD